METDVINDLEDGEIEDDDCEPVDDIYTPLERPPINNAPALPIVKEPSDHDELSSDSSSDSDDSNQARKIAKQKKKTLNQRLRNAAAQQPKKRNYNIWCTDATEEILTNNLLNCNVDRVKDKSRDVESYDPSFAFDRKQKDGGIFRSSLTDDASNKRKRHGRLVATARRKFNDVPNPASELSRRTILPLSTSSESSATELAQDMANKLLEEKESVILSVIEVLGKEKAIQLFEETVRVEHNGGLLIMNGTRRRTPGGVYFYLLKSSSDVTPEQVSEIFRDDRKKLARDIKKSKAAKRREAINKEDYPTLLSKAEAAIYKMKEIEAQEAEEVKNPPPSPATDGRDNSSDGEETKTNDVIHNTNVRLESSLPRCDDSMDI